MQQGNNQFVLRKGVRFYGTKEKYEIHLNSQDVYKRQPQESYEVHIQNGGEASETRNADPEVQVLQEETIHEVQKLVQQLPEKYRLVVYLYYSADMKLTEIAECLHLSVNTVKTRLRKAKSLLKEKLEVIGYER